MRIVKLEAENVKRLKAVSITPAGSVVRIQGQNGAGKTSVLDSIAYALGGERLCPAEPIRRGEKSARAVIELDEDIVVERRWTAGGTRLEVRNKKGLKYPSPQKLLDGLVGRLSFDPLAFQRLGPKEQAETLRQLAGVDCSGLDQRRRAVYENRAGVNRQLSQLRARLSALPEVDAPDQPVSAADLLAEHEARRQVQAANEAMRRDLAAEQRTVASHEERVANTQGEIRRLEAALHAARERLGGEARALYGAVEHCALVSMEIGALVEPDLKEIPRRLREVEATNALVRARQQRAAVAADVAKTEAEAARLEAEIATIDQQKAELLAQAQFPIPGLGFTDSGVTLNGLPLEQASGAEQLRVSLAMGIALNPQLKVLLIRDASLLDEKSMALVAEMAEQAGAQVWLEVVGKGGVGIVIEDGQVEGAEPAAKEKEAVHG